MQLLSLWIDELKRNGRWRWMGVFGLLWALFWMVMVRRIDPDFGWHFESGRYILTHGIPARDIYSYTAPNFPWINHEWLSDVLIALAMKLGGYSLTAGLFGAMWAGALMLAARTWKLPVLAIGFAAVLGLAVARPNVWSALFFAVMLVAMNRGWRWRLVPMFVIWANLHGGFVLGFVVLLVAAWRDRRYLWVLAGSVFATFLNPYGPRLYVEIWRTLSDPQLHGRVQEWRPLEVNWMTGFYIVLVLLVAFASGWRQRKYVLPGVILAGTFVGVRYFPLFVLSSLSILEEGYEIGWKFLRIRGGKRWLVTALALFVMVGPAAKLALSPNNNLPDREIADLRANPCGGQVFNDYDFGGYMIWKLPGVKVFIDGRMPSWQMNGVSYYQQWRDVIDVAGSVNPTFARYDVKCALLSPTHSRLARQLLSEGWRVSLWDANGVLLRAKN